MDATKIIESVELAARRVGVPVRTLCEEIEINRSTWQRWKAGGEPRAEGWAKLRDLQSKYQPAA